MTEMTQLCLKRWKKGYDFFIKGDFENALNLFELIEYSCPDKTCVPIEIALNKILAIVALDKHDQLLEIGSRLLRSNHGPFFLFSLGLILEKVRPKLALDYFKKCIMTLKGAHELLLERTGWTLLLSEVYINMAIVSHRAEELDLINYYLGKALDFAIDADLRTLIEEYAENGLDGESCIGIPKDICIPPPQDDIESPMAKERKEEPLKNEPVPYLQTPLGLSHSIPHSPTSSVVSEAEPEEDSHGDRRDESEIVEKEPEFYSYLKNIRSTEKLNIKTKHLPETSDNHYKSPPPSGLVDDLFFDPKLVSPQIQEEFLPESGYIQIFGIWKACAAQIDGKELKIYDKETRSIVNLVIPLSSFCKIVPETGISYKKSNIFKLTNSCEEYLFAIQDLQTSLVWISKILKASLDIPTTSRGVKLLKTGLGKAPLSMDQ